MSVAKTETEAVHLLWSQDFFKAGRTFDEIKKELSKQGYHFPDNRLGRALSRAKYLNKLGKRGSYRFIQRYPYSKGE